MALHDHMLPEVGDLTHELALEGPVVRPRFELKRKIVACVRRLAPFALHFSRRLPFEHQGCCQIRYACNAYEGASTCFSRDALCVGWTTVLVGRTSRDSLSEPKSPIHACPDADFTIGTVHELPDIFPGLFA